MMTKKIFFGNTYIAPRSNEILLVSVVVAVVLLVVFVLAVFDAAAAVVELGVVCPTPAFIEF